MFQGMGAVIEKESPDVLRLKSALRAWAANPDAASMQGALYGAAMLWAAKTRPSWTPLDKALAATLQRWAAAPRDLRARQALLAATMQWAAGKHAIKGMGEYFAPSGVGEYFAESGMGEYFAESGLGGLGAEAVVPEACDAFCSDKMRPMMFAVGAVSLGVGLAVATVAFR